jgi:hypothetical protein
MMLVIWTPIGAHRFLFWLAFVWILPTTYVLGSGYDQ